MLDKYEIANRALLRAEQIKSHKKERITVALRTATLMLCVCIMTAAAAYLLLDKPYTVIDDPMTPLAEFPVMNGGDEADFMLPIYSSIVIKADEAAVFLPFANPEGNQYHLTFEIVLASSGESLYTSGMLEPSVCVGEVTIARPLQAGRHKATLIVTVYEPGGAEVTSVTISITITAE